MLAKRPRTAKAGTRPSSKRQNAEGRRRNFLPRTVVSYSLGPLGFPKQLRCALRYCETFAVTITSGTIGHYNFSCNGLYDPNVTGTGHQPMYFDTLMGIYDHYTVIGSKAKVTCLPNVSSNGLTNFFGVYINDDATRTPATLAALQEQTTAKNGSFAYASNMTKSLTTKWSAKSTFGGSVLGNDNLQGTASTNPTEQSMFTVWASNYPGEATNYTAYFNIEIEYIAVFDELKDLAEN